MMIGPEPMRRIFLMSVRFGIRGGIHKSLPSPSGRGGKCAKKLMDTIGESSEASRAAPDRQRKHLFLKGTLRPIRRQKAEHIVMIVEDRVAHDAHLGLGLRVGPTLVIHAEQSAHH